MTTYAWPSITPSSMMLTPLTNTKSFQSPMTGGIQTAARQGGRWQLTINHNNLTAADRSILMAFLARLNGQEHRFTIGPYGETYRGTGNGTPLVNGASQSGYSIITDGWANSETVIKAGDFFSFGTELKICTADTASDGSGNATIPCWPEIHSSPANNAAINISTPAGIFLLADAPAFPTQPGLFTSFTVNAIEDVLA